MGYDMAKYLSTYNFDLFLVAKDKKELEQLILSHMQFTDLAGIADDSLQETMDLLYGRSTNIWSSSPIEKESQDNENKKNKLKENLQKTDRALERLKKGIPLR